MNALAVFGASGHGKVVAEAALLSGWKHVAFFDDRWPVLKSVGEWAVSGDTDTLLGSLDDFDGVVVGIGSCRQRARKQDLLREAGAPIRTVIHPNACVSPRAIIERGSVVLANAVVGIHAVLAGACIVNTSASVDHDCRLGYSVHVAPGARLAGGVHVGDFSWVGMGACVREGLVVGSGVTIGAGAVVVGNVADNLTVLGVPARPADNSRSDPSRA